LVIRRVGTADAPGDPATYRSRDWQVIARDCAKRAFAAKPRLYNRDETCCSLHPFWMLTLRACLAELEDLIELTVDPLSSLVTC